MEEVETETTQEMTRKQERFEEEKRELKRGLKIKEQGRMIGANLTSQAIVIGARQEWKLKNIWRTKWWKRNIRSGSREQNMTMWKEQGKRRLGRKNVRYTENMEHIHSCLGILKNFY